MSRAGGPRRTAILIAVVAGAAALFLVGSDVRQRMGFEFSTEGLESLRAWILSLGWKGPLAFTVLVALRGFLFLPSHVVLVLGGISFGVVGGTLWGAVGILLSALLQFGAARILGDDWLQPRLGAQSRVFEERIRRFGPGAVWIFTAHPLGPQTPINLCAGLVAMNVGNFVLAVVLAAPIRAGVYAALGNSVVAWDDATSLYLAVAFVALVCLPLAIPSVRRWLAGAPEDPPRSSEAGA